MLNILLLEYNSAGLVGFCMVILSFSTLNLPVHFTNYEAQQSTHITLVTVVGRLILYSALVGDLLSSCYQLVPQDLNVLNRLKETVSEKEERKKYMKCPCYLIVV